MKDNIFEIKERFYLNGKPFKIISGGIHYFRVVPEYWKDRLEKLKAMGCNTVETYVPWNMHEPKPGTFDFSGMLDIGRFIKTAQELGLYVIVRPSPFICAEWEFGGLPAWLLAEDGMRLRVSYAPYLDAVKRYYQELFKILSPLQINFGGPIILFQIENEYGYYGNDKNYLNALKDIMLENGTVVPFFTSDGPWGDALSCGTVDGVLPTGNFGSKAEEQFKQLSKFTNGGPLMCMEFWVGWFDSWGCGKHNTSNLEENIKDLDDILRLGNINIYMFHGGTNFGFMNGSNYYDELTPDVTSYDYDAVLSESGDLTPKYEAFQKVIANYVDLPHVEFSTNIIKKDYGAIKLAEKVSLFNVLDDISLAVKSPYPLPMEKLGQNFGYTFYRCDLGEGRNIENFKLLGANDRAQIFINQKHLRTLCDRELLEQISFDLSGEDRTELSILTENMGRVNFGQRLEHQQKGIAEGVIVNGHFQIGWEQYALPLDNLDQLDFSKGYLENTPSFYRFTFDVQEMGDTFLDCSGWGKGCAFINDFNLGRFWEKGPQKRLYLPAPLLKKGKNEIILFETEGKVQETISLKDEPALC